MVSHFGLYLISIASGVRVAACVFGIVTLSVSLIAVFLGGFFLETNEEVGSFRERFKQTLVIGTATTLFGLMVPNSREMAAIYVVPKIANSESLAEIGQSVKTLFVEWAEELRPSKGKEKDDGQQGN